MHKGNTDMGFILFWPVYMLLKNGNWSRVDNLESYNHEVID